MTSKQSLPYLLRQAGDEDKLFLQFGGQGGSWLKEMTSLYHDFPELKKFFDVVFAAIDDGMDYLQVSPPILEYGFNLKCWLEGHDIPPLDYLTSCSVALTCVHVTQSAYYHLLVLHGHDPQKFFDSVAGMTGHSMGFHSAHLAALGYQGDEFYDALKRFVLFVLIGGVRCQQAYPLKEHPEELKKRVERIDPGASPSPMVATLAIPYDVLQNCLDELNQDIPSKFHLTIALVNTDESLVVSGREEDLINLRENYQQVWEQFQGRWAWLEVSAPFHSHILRPAWDIFQHDQEKIGFYYKGYEVKVPVYSTFDGRNIQEMDELYRYSFLLMTSTPLNWIKSIAAIDQDKNIKAVADFGPGRVSSTFTKGLLKRDIELLTTTRRKTLDKLIGQEQV